MAQDKNETLDGFGVRLINICWVPTVYKHWAKDLGPREDAEGLDLQATEGEMPVRLRKRRSWHSTKKRTGEPDLSLDRTHRCWRLRALAPSLVGLAQA